MVAGRRANFATGCMSLAEAILLVEVGVRLWTKQVQQFQRFIIDRSGEFFFSEMLKVNRYRHAWPAWDCGAVN